MKNKAFLFLFSLIITGCSVLPSFQKESVSDEELQSTLHWMVDDAVMLASTQIVYEMKSEMKTMIAEQPSSTPVYILPEQNTPIPTSIQQSNQLNAMITATPAANNCVNKVKFIQDITVPDWSIVSAGKPFTKTWRLQNTGSCIWDDSFSFVFSDGDIMGAKERISLSEGTMIKPDDKIDIAVYMVAPEKPGKYTGNWLIEDSVGNRFGTGENNDKAIWVKVEVK